MFSYFFLKNHAICEMWENIVEVEKPQMTVWHMCIWSFLYDRL